MKVGARVLKLWLDDSSGLKWPKFSLQATDPPGQSIF